MKTGRTVFPGLEFVLKNKKLLGLQKISFKLWHKEKGFYPNFRALILI